MFKQIIEHKYFEIFIISLIVLNGITMWLETYKSIMIDFWELINYFNIFVISIFVIEALMKIITYKKEYFKNWWNLFDFSIVIISVIPASWPFEILRILRVLRLLRLITIIPSMRKIVWALFSVIPGMLSVWALLMIIFYVFAIMTTTLYWENFPEWFGSLWNSFYTLFQIMTLESWSMGIVRPIMEIHPNAWFLFIIFVLISTFVMINLIIAIVVEAMNKINHWEEKKDTIPVTKKDIEKLEKKVDDLMKLLQKK